MNDHHYYSNFIWQIADLLRGPYRPPQYERVMLARAQAIALLKQRGHNVSVLLHVEGARR